MFGLDEEVKKLMNIDTKNPPSVEKMAKIFALCLDRVASEAAFKLYRHPQFRQLADLESLEKIEQNRIFNELVLATITLLMLTLESPDLRASEESKDYFVLVKEKLPQAHLDELGNLGIEKKYLEDWDKLIQMRYEEYREDKLKIREAAMNLESKERGLTVDGLGDIHLVLPVQTVAIGCHYHICRGKVEGKDKLFKFTLRHLGRFYAPIRAHLEGGKFSFFGRLKVKMRHFVNDLKGV